MSNHPDEKIAYLKTRAKEIRTEVVKMIHKAQTGHPGGSLSAADIMSVLYFDELTIRPDDPKWEDRDRFILSKGHACPVWYACLALRGFIPLETLGTLRQLGSPLQGHPVMTKCPGVDATAGSLGIGFGMAVGMALEAKMTGKTYRVYAILGDGEVQEGIVYEAAQSASKFGLDNMVMIIDNNRLQNDGFTQDIIPVESLDERFRSLGWETKRINGHIIEEILEAFADARKARGKPFCIIADTVKGKGVSFMENIREWHGRPPSDEQCEQALSEIRGGSC